MKVKTLLSILLVVSACSSDDDPFENNTANNANNQTVNNQNNDPGAACKSACDVKASDCGIIRSEASGPCSTLCAQEPDADSATCIEESDCAMFEPGLMAGEFCGLGSSEPETCQCDPNPNLVDTIYGYCEGTGICGFVVGNNDGKGCLHTEASGEGECVFLCEPEEIGTQGSCPAGFTCEDSGKNDGTSATNWSVCDA